MKVNIVVVNYNSSHATIDMLKSLNESDDSISQIIIVDCNSASDDFNKLLTWISASTMSGIIFLKRLEENVGYFGGLNEGIKELINTSACYTIVGNNDLLFSRDFFSHLTNLSLPPNVYALCPSVKTRDGVYENPSMLARPSKRRLLFYDLYYSNYYVGVILLKLWRLLGFGKNSRLIKDNENKEIFIGIGAIYILTPSFFKCNSTLSNPTFLYGEEAFLSKQIYATGGIQFYNSSLEVTHLERVSTRSIANKKKYFMTQQSYQLYRSYFQQ